MRYLCRPWWDFLIAIPLSMVLCGSIAAEPVRINDGRAHGFMFTHAGNCYAVLPAHGAGNGERIAIATGEPVRNGSGFVAEPFWPGIDLAVAFVRRGVHERCTEPVETLLSARLDAITRAEGDLIRIQADGQVMRVPMRIVRTDYLDFEATIIDPPAGDAIYQGMSGSFFFMGTRPVGMALERTGPASVRFMRIEEIALNLGRWLGTESARFDDAPPSAGSDAGKGIELILADAQTPAIDPRHMAENVLKDAGAYIFEPQGPAVIILSLADSESFELKRVVLRSEAGTAHALPKSVHIAVDSTREGPGRWRTFWRGEMARDGLLDTGLLGGTRARRVRITIRSAWDTGPVRIDRVEAY